MLVKHWITHLRRVGAVLAVTALAACGGGGGGGGGGGDSDSSTPTTNITLPYSATLSGTSGAKRNFVFTLPAGLSVVSIKLSGGSGALNMSATDSTGATKCPTVTHSGKEVACNVNNPASGQWTVAITGGTTFSGVSISVASGTATVSLPHNAAGVSGALNSDTFYTFIVPAGMTAVQAQLSGGTGDADLYLISPTGSTGKYCASEALNTNVEFCAFNNPGSGLWTVQLMGFAAYTGATLNIATGGAVAGYPSYTFSAGSTTVSTNTGLSGALNSSGTIFSAAVTGSDTKLSAKISGGTGNADFRIMNPNGDVVCRTRAIENTDECTILQPTVGTWEVELLGTTAYSGVALTLTKN